MKIKHVMLDGTVRNSIEGMVVPADHPVYKLLAKVLLEKRNETTVEDKKSMAG
ncbi:MAG: BOW99_gp33 family protein [Clostridium sp.]